MNGIDGKSENEYDHTQKEVNRPMSMARQVMNTDPEWITTGEAARILQVGSINTVKRWAREGKLRYRRPGGEQGRIQIERTSVEKLLHSSDSELQAIQNSERALDELDSFGREMTSEELDEVEGHRIGKLPWPKST